MNQDVFEMEQIEVDGVENVSVEIDALGLFSASVAQMPRSESALLDIRTFAVQIRDDRGLRCAVRVFGEEMNVIGQQRLLRIDAVAELDEYGLAFGAFRSAQSVVGETRLDAA